MIPAQDLSKEDALSVADKLVEKEILTEQGASMLKKKIDEKKFRRSKRESWIDGSTFEKTELAPSHILMYLSTAFSSDFYYRTGTYEVEKVYQELLEGRDMESLLKAEEWEKYNEEVMKEVEKRMKKFEGIKIEKRIKNEETFKVVEARSFIFIRGFPKGVSELSGMKFIANSRSVGGKTLSRTAKDLNGIGLIDSTTLTDALQKINSQSFKTEAKLLEYLEEKAAFLEDYEENKLEEQNFIKGLHQQKILSDGKLKELLDSSLEKKLYNKFELIGFCEKAKIFELDQYPEEPGLAFQKFFIEIRKFIPGFNFTAFEAKVIDMPSLPEDEKFEKRIQISFRVSDQRYFSEGQLGYFPKKPKKNQKSQKVNVPEQIVFGINKFLSDQNSPYRLHFAIDKFSGDWTFDMDRFGVILLSKEQLEAWGHNNERFLSIPNFDNRFNRHGIQKILSRYKEIGLFEHLNEEEYQQGLHQLSTSTVESLQDILLAFPKTIVYFDWEADNLKNPYEALTKEFGAASRGTFTPSNIQDDFDESWEKESVNYSFEYNGKVYKENLVMQSDWLDSSFMKLINKAMKEQKIEGKFYYCLENGQENGFIFLNSSQFKILSKEQAELFPD
ncbi:MAG: hypothetical protein MRZ79_15935 [Bacteroidia bacterium]|nr:hypothetical protein [Bacteroidia bacterium]